jgi:hypothetical protein
MSEHLSILRPAGVAVLVLAAAWLFGRTRIPRRTRGEATARRSGTPSPLPALPNQRATGPHREAVDLTPAEQAAFAGLVRRLGDGDGD